MAVVIPYHIDPIKYLYTSIHYWSTYGLDVYVVTPDFLLLPPKAKRIKQKTSGLLARWEAFTQLVREYDVIINSDSHVWSSHSPDELIKSAKGAWASACHYIYLYDIPTPRVHCYSYLHLSDNTLYWCFSTSKDTDNIYMTNEPVIAYDSKTLETILDKYYTYHDYAIDHAALLFTAPGVLVQQYKFIHVSMLKPTRRPRLENVYRLIEDLKNSNLLYKVQKRRPNHTCVPLAKLKTQ